MTVRAPSPLLVFSLLLACGPSTSHASATAPFKSGERTQADEIAQADVAYLAGGCFWGVEHYMEQLDGVLSVESGYMGGEIDAPTYAQVSSHRSGHLEAVRVRFDASRVSFEAIAKRFFEIHDPTQVDGQGPDLGPQYLSAVFYTDDEQKRVVGALIARLRERGFAVATQLRPATKFWEAEADHQDYYARTGKTPYCHAPVDRFGDES